MRLATAFHPRAERDRFVDDRFIDDRFIDDRFIDDSSSICPVSPATGQATDPLIEHDSKPMEACASGDKASHAPAQWFTAARLSWPRTTGGFA
ncbi:MAG: hypothetical protein ACOH1R_09140 [Luteimonas sp.]